MDCHRNPTARQVSLVGPGAGLAICSARCVLSGAGTSGRLRFALKALSFEQAHEGSQDVLEAQSAAGEATVGAASRRCHDGRLPRLRGPRQGRVRRLPGRAECQVRAVWRRRRICSQPMHGMFRRRQMQLLGMQWYRQFSLRDVPWHRTGGSRRAMKSARGIQTLGEARMLHDDTERNRLQAAADATGIVQRIEAANRACGRRFPPFRWHALSPDWAAGFRVDGKGFETDCDVVFFLNPAQQDRNNFGWFSVEELDLWLSGLGPIVKAPKPSVRP